LKQAGIVVRKIKPDYEEIDKKHLTTRQLVRSHAIGKALSAARHLKEGVLVSADTLVVHKGKRIGKPRDIKHALQILSSLQGRTHHVLTGVAMLLIRDGQIRRKKYFVVKTEVTIKPLSLDAIRAYFKRIQPLDKAGAYAIQSKRLSIVQKIRGSYTNAMGLPMEKLKKELDMLE
jgi:septum formation protein